MKPPLLYNPDLIPGSPEFLAEYTQKAFLALQNEPPLLSIEIDGRHYKLGTLSAGTRLCLGDIGTRIVNGTASRDDRWPYHIIVQLLMAADPKIDVKAALQGITGETNVVACREFMRQCIVAALDPAKSAGRA